MTVKELLMIVQEYVRVNNPPVEELMKKQIFITRNAARFLVRDIKITDKEFYLLTGRHSDDM